MGVRRPVTSGLWILNKSFILRSCLCLSDTRLDGWLRVWIADLLIYLSFKDSLERERKNKREVRQVADSVAGAAVRYFLARNVFDVEYIYGFVWWGVCRQSRWRHSVTVPHTRWRICVTMATLWQQQDGRYMLLWKRYGNNKMAAMRYYGNVIPTFR